MTATIPGISSWPETVVKYSSRAWTAARQKGGKKRSSETEEKTQHFGNCKDYLSMGNIQEKLFPHPLAPHLKPLRMTRWAESACLAGKHEEAFLPTV
jgi:hypothetical protein